MRHNTPDNPPRPQRLIVLVKQLQIVERLLLQPKGATAYQIAEAIGKSEKQARRSIAVLKDLGVTVVDDYAPGDTEPAVYRAKRGSKLFA